MAGFQRDFSSDMMMSVYNYPTMAPSVPSNDIVEVEVKFDSPLSTISAEMSELEWNCVLFLAEKQKDSAMQAPKRKRKPSGCVDESALKNRSLSFTADADDLNSFGLAGSLPSNNEGAEINRRKRKATAAAHASPMADVKLVTYARRLDRPTLDGIVAGMGANDFVAALSQLKMMMQSLGQCMFSYRDNVNVFRLLDDLFGGAVNTWASSSSSTDLIPLNPLLYQRDALLQTEIFGASIVDDEVVLGFGHNMTCETPFQQTHCPFHDRSAVRLVCERGPFGILTREFYKTYLNQAGRCASEHGFRNPMKYVLSGGKDVPTLKLLSGVDGGLRYVVYKNLVRDSGKRIYTVLAAVSMEQVAPGARCTIPVINIIM